MTATSSRMFGTLTISPKNYVYHVQLSRPEKLNAMNETMWLEFKKCFDELAVDPDCRSIVLSGAGKAFCAGIDIQNFASLGQRIADVNDVARKGKVVHESIVTYQQVFTALEKCPKPVIAAIHSACIGAGVDMTSACDIRYCTSDAWFQIKEVDLGLAADVGTLQRMPKVVGSDSLVRELVYTGRKFDAKEALQCGFVNRVFDDYESLLAKSLETAELIAQKSPVAVQGAKTSLVYSRDHSVQEGLDHVALQNRALLQSEDVIAAVTSELTKEPAVFSKL